jgi:hypothetical protein
MLVNAGFVVEPGVSIRTQHLQTTARQKQKKGLNTKLSATGGYKDNNKLTPLL